MQFSVLSSGSKANATVVRGSQGAILIDCGLSCRRLEERLRTVGVHPSEVKAVIISHEHSDHVIGASAFSRRHRIPVYMNDGTFEGYRASPGDKRLYHREPLGRGFCGQLEGFELTVFPVPHDAADPVAFRLSAGGLHFAQCTDLGRVTPLVSEQLAGLHALVLESNHDEDLLAQCEYPWALKQRILSNTGHLSNHTAGALIKSSLHSDLRLVVLGHLSEHSNTPEVALQTVRGYLPQEAGASPISQLLCASVNEATPLFRLGEGFFGVGEGGTSSAAGAGQGARCSAAA